MATWSNIQLSWGKERAAVNWRGRARNRRNKVACGIKDCVLKLPAQLRYYFDKCPHSPYFLSGPFYAAI
jgi:hypothetical protein